MGLIEFMVDGVVCLFVYVPDVVICLFVFVVDVWLNEYKYFVNRINVYIKIALLVVWLYLCFIRSSGEVAKSF